VALLNLALNNYLLVVKETINWGLGGVGKIVARFRLSLMRVIHEIIKSPHVIQDKQHVTKKK
jgi:hypothetical protein